VIFLFFLNSIKLFFIFSHFFISRTDEKSLNKKTPIIAFTALSDSPTQNYMNVGMNGLLAKPFTKNELYNILQKWLSNDRKDKIHH